MNYAIPVGLIDLISSKPARSARQPCQRRDGDAYGSVLGMKLMLDALGERIARCHA